MSAAVSSVNIENSIDTDVDIPDPAPGLTFAARPDGLIGLESGGAPSEHDAAQIAQLRGAVRDALDSLLTSLRGSNAHEAIAAIGHRYQVHLEADPCPIDLVYAFGLRLENAHIRLRQDIARGDLPDMPLRAGEALDSVLAIHGPMIASTIRGRELLDSARAYAQSSANTEEYRAKARELGAAIERSDGLVTEEASEVVVQFIEEAGQGEHPERTAEVSHTANRNLLITIATFAVLESASGVISTVVQKSIPGGLAIDAIRGLVNASWLFLSDNMLLLKQFIAVSGSDMTWLSALLRRIDRSGGRPPAGGASG